MPLHSCLLPSPSHFTNPDQVTEQKPQKQQPDAAPAADPTGFNLDDILHMDSIPGLAGILADDSLDFGHNKDNGSSKGRKADSSAEGGGGGGGGSRFMNLFSSRPQQQQQQEENRLKVAEVRLMCCFVSLDGLVGGWMTSLVWIELGHGHPVKVIFLPLQSSDRFYQCLDLMCPLS